MVGWWCVQGRKSSLRIYHDSEACGHLAIAAAVALKREAGLLNNEKLGRRECIQAGRLGFGRRAVHGGRFVV
jgi:hypothetical protein